MESMVQSLKVIVWTIILICITQQSQAILNDNNHHNDKFGISTCQIYGGFHLRKFHEQFDQSTYLSSCKNDGDHVFYENQWIKIMITVTHLPYLIEKYKMIFKDQENILCIIDNNQNICNHQEIKVHRRGLITYIVYPMASLRMIVVQYGNESYYDVMLYQKNVSIVHQSKGLCVHPSTQCEMSSFTRKGDQLEHQLNVINPTNLQRLVHENAAEICSHYYDSIHQIVSELGVVLRNSIRKDLSIISCMCDLKLTGNIQFVKSILHLSLFDILNEFNISDDDLNSHVEKSHYILDKSTSIVDDLIFKNITLNQSQSYQTLKSVISESTTIQSRSIGIVRPETNTSTLFSINDTVKSSKKSSSILYSISENNKNKSICHVYGDPHIISFAQQINADQDQYWCKISGEHIILKNSHVEIKAFVENQTWLINKFIIKLFDENQNLLCTIRNDEQYCDNRDIIITRPSLMQMDILYITPELHIAVVHHQHKLEWYDINVRIPYTLIDQSSGLCVMPSVNNCNVESANQENIVNPASRLICEQYLIATTQALLELDLVNDSKRYNDAFMACIHDYQTTDNIYFGVSIVDMIIKNGINSQQLNNVEFELKTIESMLAIDKAFIDANIQIEALNISTTTIPSATTMSITATDQITSMSTIKQTSTITSMSTIKQTSTITSMSTIKQTSTITSMSTIKQTSTITSRCAITVKSNHVILVFILLLLLFLIEILSIFLI